jgi:catechol 2,3-dioxygenase-like lactoylglutathione lyase family enzyme
MSLKFDMLGLVCKDVAESLRFYRILGVPAPEYQPGEPYVECTLDNGLRLSWNSVEMMKQIDPAWEEPAGHRMGMAFLCESPAAVDAAYADVLKAGFLGHKEPFDAFWGQRYAQVLDPDGNIVDLFAWMPEAA